MPKSAKMYCVMHRVVEKRRELQHQVLKDWDKGSLTARECIERILDLEKIIVLDKNILQGEEHGNEVC